MKNKDPQGHLIDDIGFHKLYRSTYVRNFSGDEDGCASWDQLAEATLVEFIKRRMIFDGKCIKLAETLKKGETNA